MKKILLCLLILQASCSAKTQQQSFDITNYIAPKGWKKQTTESAMQFSKEDATTGGYCIITLLKAIPANAGAKENFDAAWETVVKEMVKVSAAPEMQPSATEDGWQIQSGYAPFDNEGEKGLALLVTSTGYDKMVNLLVLTNTDVYEKEMTAFIESISFKKQTQTNNNSSTDKNKTPVSTAKKDGFAFSTTNFDDGWNSTVQEDWVEVTNGNIKVLLHYPRDETIFPADPEPLTNAVWNILVAPRYSTLKNYKTAYISTYNRPYLGMGYLTDNSSRKEVFVVLFRQGDTGWMEVIAPDKNSFIQQFKFDPETIQWNSETDLLKHLLVMPGYNKFAIAASDFTGSWSSDFTGIQQLYNVYTGNYAGMNMNQSNETFQFGAGNTYNWKFLAVNGMAGNAKFAQVKSAGKFTVLNNWQIKFSDIEGRPQTYHAQFSCIKGARVLKLLNAQSPGSGIYTVFGKQ